MDTATTGPKCPSFVGVPITWVWSESPPLSLNRASRASIEACSVTRDLELGASLYGRPECGLIPAGEVRFTKTEALWMLPACFVQDSEIGRKSKGLAACRGCALRMAEICVRSAAGHHFVRGISAMKHSKIPAALIPDDSIPVLRPDGSLRTLAEVTDALIDYAIQTSGSFSVAADLLGIGRSTLYRHLAAERDVRCGSGT